MVVHLVNPVCLERNIKAIWVIVATLVILVILAYFEILRPDMDLRNNTCVYPVTYKHIHTCTYTCTHPQSNVHTQKSYIFLMAKEKTFKIGSMCFSLWYFVIFTQNFHNLHKRFPSNNVKITKKGLDPEGNTFLKEVSAGKSISIDVSVCLALGGAKQLILFYSQRFWKKSWYLLRAQGRCGKYLRYKNLHLQLWQSLVIFIINYKGLQFLKSGVPTPCTCSTILSPYYMKTRCPLTIL